MRTLGIIGLTTAILAIPACDGRESEGPKADSAAACLEKLAVALRSEVGRANGRLFADEIQADVEGSKASVIVGPAANSGVRGGGGRYEFNCATQELKLIEAYR